MRKHFWLAAVILAAATFVTLGPAGAGAAGAAARAAPGAQLWVARYNGPGNDGDSASSLAVSPGGTRVFVTGTSYGGRRTHDDYATIAYNAVTGRQLWASRYNGPANLYDAAHSVAVSPGGARVYVTGDSSGRTATGYDYATVADNAATGARLWASPLQRPRQRQAMTPPPWPSARTGAGCSSPGSAHLPTPRSPTTPPPARSCGSSSTTARRRFDD